MGFKKYFSFIFLGAISFMLNIFLVFNIKNYGFFKTELMFIELFILLGFIISALLINNRPSGDLLAILFFAVLLTNSIYLYNMQSSILGATMLANNLLALIFFIGQKKVKKPKRRPLVKRQEEIKDLIEEEKAEEKPKIIIEQKKFVAGKYSKYFYPTDSAQGKRIKKANRIYFDSKRGAKKAGYAEPK